jgi:hypothetical protein
VPDHLTGKTRTQLLARVAVLYGGAVGFFMTALTGHLSAALVFAMALILATLDDATARILYAVRHADDCPQHHCIARRNHLGGHVLSNTRADGSPW